MKINRESLLGMFIGFNVLLATPHIAAAYSPMFVQGIAPLGPMNLLSPPSPISLISPTNHMHLAEIPTQPIDTSGDQNPLPSLMQEQKQDEQHFIRVSLLIAATVSALVFGGGHVMSLVTGPKQPKSRPIQRVKNFDV